MTQGIIDLRPLSLDLGDLPKYPEAALKHSPAKTTNVH